MLSKYVFCSLFGDISQNIISLVLKILRLFTEMTLRLHQRYSCLSPNRYKLIFNSSLSKINRVTFQDKILMFLFSALE